MLNCEIKSANIMDAHDIFIVAPISYAFCDLSLCQEAIFAAEFLGVKLYNANHEQTTVAQSASKIL